MRRRVLEWCGTVAAGRALCTAEASPAARAASGDAASDRATARLERLLARAPRLPLPQPPRSVSGAPFPHLLHTALLAEVEARHRRLADALEYLLHIAVGHNTDASAHTDEAADTTAERERQMWKALHVLRQLQPTSLPPFSSFFAADMAVELRPPQGHVQVAPVVGFAYLQLRRLGVDVDDWWAGYYRAFVEPKGAPLHHDKATTGAGSGAVPPFYWLQRRRRCLRTWVEETAGRLDECRAEGMDEAGQAGCRFVSATPLPLLLRAPSAASRPGFPHTAAVSWRTAPASRASVWVPAGLLRYLPFFPIPYPTQLPASGATETATETAASTRYADYTDTSDRAGGPAVEGLAPFERDGSHAPSDPAVEEEDEGAEAEWPSAPEFGGDDAGEPVTDAPGTVADTPVGGPDVRGVGSATSWGAWSGLRTPALGGADASAATARRWAHPFYDSLHVSTRAMRAAAASSIAGEQPNGTHAVHRADIDVRFEWLRRRRVLQAERPGLHVKLTEAAPVPWQGQSVAATRSPDVWPRPAWYCEMQPGLWPLLNRFWAAKSHTAADLPCEYFFPCQSYPVLHMRRLQHVRQASTYTWFRRIHLQYFPSAFRSSRRCRMDDDVTRASNDALRGRLWCRPHDDANVGGGGGAALLDEPRTASGDAAAFATADLLSDPHPDWLLERVVAAAFFGTRYVCVDSTLNACLFDSNTCVQHAIPLLETGDPFFAGMRPVRYRLQHSCGVYPHSTYTRTVETPSELSSGDIESSLTSARRETHSAHLVADARPVQADNVVRLNRTPRRDPFDAAMERLARLEAASQSAALRNSRWAQRLRQIRTQQAHGDFAPPLSQVERVIKMQAVQRHLHFVFRSPYWVEASTVFERWGVRVAPGAIPLRISQTDFVNAEQTTDASRFNSQTCVPHLLQQVLCVSGISKCTWDASQRLLALLTPDVAPRGRRGGVRAWTHASLRERAAAAQRAPNLWITVSVLARFGWSVQPTPPAYRHPSPARQRGVLRATLPVHDLRSSTVRASVSAGAMAELDVPTENPTDPSPNALLRRDFGPLSHHGAPAVAASQSGAHAAARDVSFFGPPRRPGAPLTTATASPPYRDSAETATAPWRVSATPSLAIVHSSCIVEQDELLFAATFAPAVLVARVSDLQPSDWGYAAYENVLQRLGVESDAEDAATDERAAAELFSDVDFDVDDEGAGAEEEGGQGETDESQPDDDDEVARKVRSRATHVYATAMRRKKRALITQWRGTRLQFSSRLDMARLAMQKGYHRRENGQRWVLVEVLRTEPLLRPASGVRLGRNSSTEDAADATSPAPAGITAIQVQFEFFDALKLSGYSAEGKSGGVQDDVESWMALEERPSDGAESDGQVLRLVTVTLVNAAELSWPAKVTPENRRRWVWRRM